MADSLGWAATFYIEGSLSLIVVSAWLFFLYDSPTVHPRISKQEREYIESFTVASNEFKVEKIK